MYKLHKPDDLFGELRSVTRIADNSSIPFDPDNTDYQTFKKEVNEGAELQDADGNVMSAEDAQQFISTLP